MKKRRSFFEILKALEATPEYIAYLKTMQNKSFEELTKDIEEEIKAMEATPAYKVYKEACDVMETTPTYKVYKEACDVMETTPNRKTYKEACDVCRVTWYAVQKTPEWEAKEKAKEALKEAMADYYQKKVGLERGKNE